MSSVSPEEIERALRDLPSIGRMVAAREGGDRQVWRIEIGGRPYELTFYRRQAAGTHGARALRMFTNLQALQRAGVPAPRAVAHLSGLSIGDSKGDACIAEAIEPAVPLDQHLNALALRGERDGKSRRNLVCQIGEILDKLVDAKLGHDDLTLGRLLLSDGKLFLTGAEAVRAGGRGGGLSTRDVMRLGASACRFATRTDIIRAWGAFSGAPIPRTNPLRRRRWRKFIAKTTGENDRFGTITAGAWSGWFFKQISDPRRWAPASALAVSEADWQREWPNLLSAIEHERLEPLKRESGGDVLAGEVTLGGRRVAVVVKRPRHRKWHRYIKEFVRGLRARQAWTKAWSLVARDVPTAWPLIVMQRRNTLGVPVEGIMVAERVQGDLLATMDFDRLAPEPRKTLFHRLGRTLRLLERDGLLQYDSKTPNWIILPDEKLGPVPVIVDVDGIRRWTPPLWPIERLLRSLRDHPGYTPEDSYWVCVGYAPRARLVREGEDQKEKALPIDG